MLQEINRVRQRLGLAPLGIVAAGGNTRAARSARARKQLRDRYGKWIEMGGGIRWNAPSGIKYSGTVNGFQGNYVTVTDVKYVRPDGATGELPSATVHHDNVEVQVEQRADLGDIKNAVESAPAPTAASTPEQDDAIVKAFRALGADDDTIAAILAAPDRDTAEQVWSDTEVGQSVEDKITSAMMADSPQPQEKKLVSNYNYAWKLVDDKFAADEPDTEPEQPDADTRPDGVDENAPSDALFSVDTELEDWVDAREMQPGDEVMPRATGGLANDAVGVKHLNPGGRYHLTGEIWTVQDVNSEDGSQLAEITVQKEDDSTTKFIVQGPFKMLRANDNIRAQLGVDAPDPDEPNDDPAADLPDDTDSEPSDGEVYDALFEAYNSLRDAGITEDDFDYGDIMVQLDDTAQRLYGEESVDPAAIEALVDDARAMANEIDNDAVKASLNKAANQLEQLLDTPVLYGQDDESVTEFDFDYTQITAESVPDATPSGATPTLSAAEVAAQRTALAHYVGNGYRDINTGLRNNGGLTESQENVVTHLDNLIARSRLPESMELYRGVDNDSGWLPDQLEPGTIISDDAFMSVTDDESVSSEFANFGDTGVMFVIDAAAGHPAVNVKSMLPDNVTAESESEWLLPRGTQLSVVSDYVVEDGDFKRRYIEVDLVPVVQNNATNDTIEPTEENDNGTAEEAGSQPEAGGAPDVVESGPGEDNTPTEAEAEEDTTQEVAGVVQSITELDNLPAGSILEFTRPDGVVWLYEKKDSRPDSWRGPDGPMSRSFLEKAIGNGRVSVAQIPTAYADEYTPPPSQDPLLVSRDALPDGFWGFEIEPGTTPEGPSNGLTDNVWRMTPQLEGRLTKAAADGMANYLLDRRKTLNHMVRHGWTPENNYGVRHAYVSTSGWGDEDTVDAEKFYYNMLEATSLAKLPPGLRLYRGALFDKNDFPAHLEPGEYVVDTGFASTSRDRDYAVDFAGDLTQDGVHVLWEIEVGEGVTGMDMDLAHGNPEHSWNREYVLPPNTALEVIEDRGADETGLRTIRARVIPAHAMPDNAVQAYPVSDPLEPPPYDNPDISDVTNMPTVKVNKDVLAEFNEREVLLRRAVDSQPTPLSAPEEHVSALWGTAGTIYGPYLVVDGSLYNRNGRLVSPLLNQFDGIIAVEDAQFDGPAPSSIFSGEPVTELASPSDLFRLPTESVVSFTRQDGTTETYTKVGPVAWRRDGENYNSSQAALNELLKYDSVASTLVYNPDNTDDTDAQNAPSVSTTSLTENPPAESVVAPSNNDVKAWWLRQSSEALSDENWLYKPFDPYSITDIDPAIEEAVRNLESTSYASGGQQIPWKNDVQRSLEFAIAVQSAYDGDLVVDENDSEKEWPDAWTAATADAVIDELVDLSSNQDEINSRTTAAALLYKAVAAASPTTKPLYRGTNTYPGSAMYNAIVDGGVFSTHLTSWTGEKETAESYVREFPWPGEPIPVVLEAEPGAKMLDLGWVGSNTPIGFQDHWLGAGRFKVESVEIENGAYHVKVRQLKPGENPDPSGGYGKPLIHPDKTDEGKKPEPTNALINDIAELDEQPVGTIIKGRTDADVAFGVGTATMYQRASDGTWDKQIVYGEEPKKLERAEAQQMLNNGPVEILPWGATDNEATGPSFPDAIAYDDEGYEQQQVSSVDEPVDVTSWQKIGSQKGSNPGGTYVDPSGNKYYIKQSKTDDHAKNEVLARKLYDLAGIDSAQLELADVGGGKLGTVSPLVPGAKQDLSQRRFDPEYRAKLQEGFAVDAWLANWDVAGLAFDNIVTDDDGNPVRIDPGGALLFRAMGSPKGAAFGDSVIEWNTLRSGANAQSAAIFGDTPTYRLKSSAQRVANISPEEIDAAVDSVGFDVDTAERLKETLKARRLDLMRRAGVGDGASVVTEVDQDLSQDELMALRNYGKIWYTSVNGRLRNGTVDESPEVAEKIEQLDSALSKSRLTTDTQVYRGVYGDFVDQLVEGATVQDLGYMSTARTPDPAEFFATKYDSDKEAVIRINVPAGTNAVDFGMVGLTEFSQEKEVLLPRGTTLLITGVETGTDKHPNLKIITADVVPADLSVPGEATSEPLDAVDVPSDSATSEVNVQTPDEIADATFGTFEVLDDPGQSGDGYYPGTHKWGKYGAAGVLLRHVDPDDGIERFLLVQRGPGVSTNVGRWQLPGGALNSNENDYQGTARELNEELDAPTGYIESATPVGEVRFDDPTGWHYTNIAADVAERFDPTPDGTETGDAGWFTRDEIAELDLHPSLADSIGDILDKFAGDDSEPPVDELPATSDLDDVAVETDVDAPPAPPAASSELADLPKLPYGTVGDSTNGPYVTLSDGTNVSVGSAVAHPTKGYTGVIEKVEKNGKYVQVAVNEHGGVWHGLTTSKLVSGDVQQTTVPPAPSPEPEPVLMPDNGEWDIPDDVRSGISDVVAALEYVDLSESSSLQALARVADEDDDYSVDNRDHLLSILYDADADLGYMSQTGPSQSTKTAATTARELLQDLITGLEGERVSEPNQIVDAEVGLEPSADFSVGKQITVDDDTTNIPVGTVLRLQSGVFAGGQEFILKIDDGSWITRDGLDLTDTEVENYIGSDNVSVFVDRVGDNEPLEWDSDFENYFVGDQSFANYEGSPQDASSDVDVQPESPSDVPAAEIDGNAWLQSQPKMPYGQVGYTDGGAVYATLGDGTNVLIGSTVSHPAKGYTGTVVDIEANGKYVQVLVNETGKKHGLTTSKLVGVQQRSAPDAPTAADEQTSPTTPAASPQLDEITLDMLAGMLPAHKAKLTTSLYNAIQLSNDDTATNRAKADAFKTVHSKLQQVKSDNGAADDAQLDALDTFEFAIESVIKSYDPSWNASVEPVESVESIEQLTPGDQIPSVSVLNGLPAGSIVHFKPYSNSATYVYIKRGNGKWYMQVGEQLHDVVDPAALEASVDAGSITFASAPSVQSDEDASTTSPDVPGLTWGSLVSGDKIPGVAVLEELPVGSVVEYAVDDDTPDTYIKNADGQWELHPYSLTKIDSDAWTQAINAGHAFFVSVPSNLPTVSTPFYVNTPAQLDELPAGSKLTYTVPSSGNTYNYTKSAGGKWTLDDGSMAPFPSEAFGYLINDAPNSVVVTSVPALTPQDLAGTAPLPAPGEILTNKQQLIDLPPGSTMTYTSPIYGVGTDYIKLDNGNWASMEQGAEASNAAFFVPLTEGQVSLKSLPQPQPSPSTQAPDATSLPPAPSGPHRNDAFGNPVFVGTKVQSTNTGETGYVVQMHSNPNYVKVAFTDSNGKTKTKVRALSKLEALDKYAPVQSDGLTADFSLVPGSYMNDNDMLDALHIGSKIAVRQHNSVEQLWTKTDTNTYVNDVSGSAVDKHYFSNFAATGQLKYVSAPPGPKTPASLSSPTVQPSHTIDPSSPWFGKPKPVAPPPLSESTTPWVVDSEAFENEVRTNYPLVFDGKLYDASTITKERVDTVVESGDKDNLKSLYNRKLISDDTYNALLSHINIVEGYKAQELADYAASMAKYESDLSAWMKAHGLSDGEFDVGSFISKGMNEGVVTHTSNSQAEEWWSSRMPGATHFSASAKSGLKSYVSSSYSLNIALRQDRMATLQPGYTPHTGGVMFTKMEKAMKEATPVPEDVIVFRGGDLKEWMLPDGTNASTKESFLAKVKPGAIVRDFGYVSASVGTSAAFSHKSLQIRIRVSKGTKAIFVGGNGLGGFSGERELILYRNTHYLVHSVYVDGNQIRVDVETVPPGWTPEQGALNEQAVVNAAQAAIDAVSNADAPEEIPDTLAPPTFTKKSTFALDYHRAAEKMVIKQYTEESGTRYYNDRLRSGEVVLPAPRLSAIGAEHYQRLGGDTNGENYDALDSAIARQRTKNPATVYRGIAMPDTFDPAVGDVISDLGYSSTSNSKEMASAFAEMRATGKSSNLNMIGVAEPSGGKPVVMEIYLPEGTPGVVGDTSVGEVILPRQSKFRVHGKRDDGTLVVEWIGAGEL